MNLLFITEKFPYPLNNGGNIRTYHILKNLSNEHNVTLFSMEPEKGDLSFLKKVCTVRTFPRERRTSLWKLYYLLCSIWGTKPYPINKNYSKGIEKALRKSLQNNEFDCVHFNHIDAAIYFDVVKEVSGDKLLTVFDTHNILSELLNTVKEHSFFMFTWFIGLQEKKILELEYRYFRSVDSCLVCSKEEADKIRLIEPKTALKVVPNGVDIEHFSRRKAYSHEGKPQKLVFIGAMGYYPNVDAVLFFSDKVLPLILKEKPNVEFWVVGNDPPKEVRALEGKLPVHVTGHVDDVRDYVEGGQVFVVPLRSGGGTKLKVLDALAMEIPVVSTNIGAKGISVENGENILLADSPEELANCIMQVLEDKKKADKLIKNGRKLVCEHYSWDVIGEEFLNIYCPRS